MIKKEEFEKIANKIIDKFNCGFVKVRIKFGDRNLPYMVFAEVTHPSSEMTHLDVSDFAKHLYDVNIACRTLELVWHFMGDKDNDRKTDRI